MPSARFALLLALAGTLALGAGCGGDDDANAPPLEGTEWILAGGVDAPADELPTLTLEEGRASGYGGCNRFMGDYEVDGESITLGPLASTMMACPEEQMAAEGAFLPALEAADSWAVEGGELVLSTGGEESLRFSAG